MAVAEALSSDPEDALPGVLTTIAQGYDITNGDLFGSAVGRIFRWTWDQSNKVIINEKTYGYPDQLSVTPMALCEAAETQTTGAATSFSEMLQNQATSRSGGFDHKVDIGIEVEDIKASTSLQNSLMFGRSSTSINYDSQLKEQRSKSSQSYCYAMAYQTHVVDAAINDAAFDKYFKEDVKQFASDPTKDAAFKFLDSWGTHVIGSAGMGGSISRTLFFEDDVDISTAQSFTDEQKSSGFDFFFIHNHKTTDEQKSVTNYDSKNCSVFIGGTETIGGNPSAESSGAFCEAVEGLKNPMMVKFEEMLPIWKYFDKIDGVTAADASNMEQHIKDVFRDGEHCALTECGGMISMCSWEPHRREWSPPCKCLGQDELMNFPDNLTFAMSSAESRYHAEYPGWAIQKSDSEWVLDFTSDCVMWNDGILVKERMPDRITVSGTNFETNQPYDCQPEGGWIDVIDHGDDHFSVEYACDYVKVSRQGVVI